MNDKSYTYHSQNTKSFTSIDLSFCHPSLFLDYNWSVCEDQHNSDHFRIIIEQYTFSTEDHSPKWKLNRANLDLFYTLCTGKLIPENFKESSDPIADFISFLIEISKKCIPQTSTNPTKSNPWYNDNCKEAIKQRKQSNKVAKIRNRYNQVPHLTQDTNGKVTNSQKTPQTRAKRSAPSQQVTTKHI